MPEAGAGPVRAAQILGTQAGACESCRVPEGMLGSSLMSPLSPLSHWATRQRTPFLWKTLSSGSVPGWPLSLAGGFRASLGAGRVWSQPPGPELGECRPQAEARSLPGKGRLAEVFLGIPAGR